MLNSERTFSQKSLYEDLENSFFRNIMAIYCENESEKLLEEMKSSCEKPENAASISKIYRRVHRSASLTSAFRVLRKITDRVALLVLAAVIIFAGAVTASAEVRSSLAEFTSRWGTFTNIGDESFDLDGEDIKSFTVDYATGWNFDSEGTRNIANGEKLFGGEIIGASSRYYINYEMDMNDIGPTICNNNTYCINYDEKSAPHFIKGIITENEHGDVIFYPYYNDNGDNLYMICKRDETAERIFKEESELSLPDGTSAKVQPFFINMLCFDLEKNDGSLVQPTMNDFSSDDSKFIEVEIMFKSITVWPFCDGEGEELWGTRAYGDFYLSNVNILNHF